MTIKLKNNKIKLYAYFFFHNLILAYVIERLFYEQRGISILEVVYLEIIYAVVIVVLEIPTGVMADRYGRKVMMIFGAISTCLEFGILILAHNFFMFVLVTIIAAFGSAVTSGTSNALLYDSMKVTNEESKFESVVGKLRFFDGLASSLAALLGGIVAFHFSLVSNYYLSLVSTIIALFISFSFVEPPLKTNIDKDSIKPNYIKQAFALLRNNKSVVIVVLNGLFIAATLVYIDEFWQLYIRDINVPIFLFGIISLSMSFLGSIGGLFATNVKQKIGYRNSFSLCLLIYFIGLLGLGIFNNYFGLLFLMIAYIPIGVVETLVYGYLHHRAESTFRATAESFQSLAKRLITIFIGLVFGYISSKYSINKGYLFLAILIFVFIVYYEILLKRKIEE